jgi:hypothetical protein
MLSAGLSLTALRVVMGRNREQSGYESAFQQTLAILRPVRPDGIASWHHLSGRTGYLVKLTRTWGLLAAASYEQEVQAQPEVSPGLRRVRPGRRPVN